MTGIRREPRTPGKAIVTITGLGSYEGPKTTSFDITGGPDLSHEGWVSFGSGARGYASGGALVRGWLDLDEGKYWFDERSLMATGRTDVELTDKIMHYYFNPASGNLTSGTWMDIEGRKYYFREAVIIAEAFGNPPRCPSVRPDRRPLSG